MADVLSHRMEDTVTEEDFESERTLVEPPFRNREEMAYYRIWNAYLDGVKPEQNLERFATA